MLYEVITARYPRPAVAASLRPGGRDLPRAGTDPCPSFLQSCVITSYSIHYTKLYDVAEELVFSTITSGASNDLERATAIARKMVCEWGMSEKLGPLTFGEKEGEIFLGRDMGHMKNYSEATAVEIDGEIRRIVQQNYDRTRDILGQRQEALVQVA